MKGRWNSGRVNLGRILVRVLADEDIEILPAAHPGCCRS